METINKFLDNLEADKQTLVNNLVEKGIEATNDETFTTLVPKVSEIETGGGDIEEYFNTEITTNTSNSLNNTLLIQLVKKIPNISIRSGVTSLQSAFMYFNGDIIPTITNTNQITNMSSMFFYNKNIKTIPLIDTSSVTNMTAMFMHCTGLETIPQLDTSKVTNMQNMFYTDYNSSLSSIPALNASQVVNITGVVNTANSTYRDRLTELGGFVDLGKAYLTTSNANYSNYTLILKNCRNLTHDSLMNVINKVYDIASIGVQTQQLQLDSTNLAKLTAEEIAIATNKGWTVS